MDIVAYYNYYVKEAAAFYPMMTREEFSMRKRNFQKIFIFITVIALLGIVFTGCSKSKGNTGKTESTTLKPTQSTSKATESKATETEAEGNLNPPGTLPIVKEPITLKVGVKQDATIEDWETNMQTLYMEEKTNIKLDFIIYPDILTNLQLAIAAGGDELPDIILASNTFNQSNVMPWAEAGMIVPITKYFDDYCYFLHESIDYAETIDFDMIKKYITYYDGEIYGFPIIIENLNNEYARSRLVLYMPWLDTLGLERPKTTQELYDVLKAFKNNDPNGNKQADEIAMTSYKGGIQHMRRFLMTPFIYTNEGYWTATNGVIDVSFTKDEWREGLRFVNKLYKEGLLDPAAFTQDEASMTATISQDPMIVGSYVRISSSNLSGSDPKRFQMINIEQLLGPDGEMRTFVNPTLPGIAGLITKNCKDVEAAFMLMDFMTGVEMSTITRWGFEGVTWEYADPGLEQQYKDFWEEFRKEHGFTYPELAHGPGAVDKPGQCVDKSKAWGTLQNVWWSQNGPCFVSQKIMDNFTTNSLDTDFDKLVYLNKYINKYLLNEAVSYRRDDLIVAGLLYTKDEQDVINENYSEIVSYVEECWAAFVTGRMDIDNDAVWNEYLNTIKNMNLDKCIAATQSCYTRMNK
jgi:putative aldouronate transport system substrate-binding protein